MIDLGGGKGATGNAAIASGQQSPGHLAAIAGGLAHFAGLPRIELDGDTAVATSYLQILTPHPSAEPHEVPNHGVSKGYRVHRVGANRWELVRTPAGWKIKRRTLRSLDGTRAGARHPAAGAGVVRTENVTGKIRTAAAPAFAAALYARTGAASCPERRTT